MIDDGDDDDCCDDVDGDDRSDSDGDELVIFGKAFTEKPTQCERMLLLFNVYDGRSGC